MSPLRKITEMSAMKAASQTRICMHQDGKEPRKEAFKSPIMKTRHTGRIKKKKDSCIVVLVG